MKRTVKWASGLSGLMLAVATGAQAATIFKTDTATMNTAADWVGGTNAAIEHVGRFDSVISAANAANLSLGADVSLGGLSFIAGLKGPVTVVPGNTLTLGQYGIDMAGASQTVTLNNDLRLATNQVWNVSDRAVTVNGVIGDAASSTLTKNGGSTLTLAGSNTYAGATLVNAGTFVLYGATGAVANSDLTLGYGTTFNINYYPGVSQPSATRGKGLTVNGVTMALNAPGSNDVNDVFSGPFTVGPGYTVVTVNPDALSKKNARLTLGSLAHNAGGVVLFRGTQLGSSTMASRASGQGSIEFVTPPTLVGGGGAFGTITNSIVPFAVGADWNHLKAEFFITYDSTYGIRKVTTYATSITSGTDSDANVRLTATPTLITGQTAINALKLGVAGTASLTEINGAGTLKIKSGAMLVYSTNCTVGVTTPGTLDFGAAEGFISYNDQSYTPALTIGSAVTGSKGLVKATGGTLSLLGPVNVGDPIRFMSGTLNVGSAVTGPLAVSRSATLNLLPGSVVTGAVDLSVASTANSMGGTVVGSLTQDDGTLNLSSNAAVVGTLSAVGSTVNITNSSVVGSVIVGPNSRGGTLYLNNGGTVAGALSIQSGSFNLRTGGAVSGVVTNLGAFNFYGASDYTLNTSFDGSGTLYQLSTTGKMTLRQASGAHAIGRLSANSGTTLVLDGSDEAYTTANYRLDPAGALYSVAGGTWEFNMGSTENASNIRISRGVLTATTNSTRFSIGCANNSTFTMTGGTLYIPSTVLWGLRLGNIHGSWNDSGFNFIGTQTGGEVIGWGGSGLEIGSSSLNKTNSYDLSGGTFASCRGDVIIGSATPAGNTSSTTLTLRDKGKLLCVATLRGEFWSTDRTYAQQIFAFKGGTLAARAYEAVNLRSTVGGARGTLFNEGGALAPGDIGAAGLTAISGSYTSAPSAVIAVDIGGTTPANAFTNAAGYYDYVNVNNGYAALDGTLRVSLINGFTPAAGNTFDVLTSTGTGAALSGNFSNTSGNQVWATDGYSRFDVTNDAANLRVRLSSYALNQWASAAGGAWTNAGQWSLTQPDGSGFAAYFGNALVAAGTVTLDAPRTLRGLTFNSAAPYTLAGASTLTLSGDAATAARIFVTNGSHTVAVPMALADALTVEVARAIDTLTLSGAVTGGQALTKTGAGALALSGNNVLGTVTVSAGSIKMTGGSSTFDALSVAANGLFSLERGLLTLSNGLTIGTGGAFNLQTYGGGTLVLKRGAAGGAIDTVAEVNAAIAAGRITVKGQTATASVFVISEENVAGVWYVRVALKAYGSMISIR